MSKPDHLVMHEITANHAFRKPLLIFLIDHPTAGGKIRLAPAVELAQRYLFFAATTLGVTDANHGFSLRQGTETAACAIRKGVYRQLDFPHTVSPIAAILLEYPRFASC